MHQIIRPIFSLLLVLFYCNISYSQGALIRSEGEIKSLGIQLFNEEELGFSVTKLPSSFSLKKYAPPSREQDGGTCVGWATAYAALSTMYNIEFEITDPFVKYATAFDPYFVYSVIKDREKDYTCDNGLYIDEAASLIESIGSKKWSIPPNIVCNTKWNINKLSDLYDYTKSFKIEEYYPISSERYDYIEKIKQHVNSGIPGIFVSDFKESFNDIGSSGLWNPSPNEVVDGGHSMTIIGYDDYKFGGAFEILNSWGSDFGDDGYVWIKYNDFKKLTFATWFMRLTDNVLSGNNPIIYKGGSLRVFMSNDNTFEGQFMNSESTNNTTWSTSLGSNYNGFGQYIWDNNNVYSGFWINGKQDGTGLWFKNSDYSMWIVEYDNGTFINSEELGFSPEEEDKVNQLKEYMKAFDPKMKFNSVSEEPDINIRSSQTNMQKNNK